MLSARNDQRIGAVRAETPCNLGRSGPRQNQPAALSIRGERTIAGLGEALSGLPHRLGHRPILRPSLGKRLQCWIFGVEPRLFGHAFNCRSINLKAEMRGHALPNRGGQIGVVDAQAPTRIGRGRLQHRAKGAGRELGTRHGRDRSRIKPKSRAA